VKDAGAPSGSPPDSNISVHLGADITLWVETPDLSGVGGGLDLRFDVWFFSILFKAGYRLSPSRDGVLRHTLPVSITMLGVVGNSVRVGGGPFLAVEAKFFTHGGQVRVVPGFDLGAAGDLSFSITESIGFHLGITWNWRLLRASTRYVDDHGKEHRILERRTALALTGGVLW
jgi:hypothetical protein